MIDYERIGTLQESLRYPKPCTECPSEDQQVFWRTFTPPAFRLFMDNDGRGSQPIDWDSLRDAQYIDKTVLDMPGVLWTSPDLYFAFSVGIARAALEGHDSVTMLGFTHCMHRIKEGNKVFDTLDLGRDKYIVNPVVSFRDLFELSAGVIFPIISHDQVRNGIILQYPIEAVEIFRDFLLQEPDITTTGLANVIQDILLDLKNEHVDLHAHLCRAPSDVNLQGNLRSVLDRMVQKSRKVEQYDKQKAVFERMGGLRYASQIRAAMLYIDRVIYDLGDYNSEYSVKLQRRRAELASELNIWKPQIGNRFMEMCDTAYDLVDEIPVVGLLNLTSEI